MRAAACLATNLAALVMLADCSQVDLHDSADAVVNQSAPQILVVANAGPDTLTIGSGTAMQTFAPGGNLTVRFQVKTISMVNKPGTAPGGTPLPPEYREQFAETDGLGLVNAGGDPLMITFRKGGAPVTASFSVSLCRGQGWRVGVAASDSYVLVVPDPIPGVPQALCPK